MASILYPVEKKDIVSRAGRTYGRIADWCGNHNFAFTAIFFSTLAVAFGAVMTFILSFAN